MTGLELGKPSPPYLNLSQLDCESVFKQRRLDLRLSLVSNNQEDTTLCSPAEYASNALSSSPGEAWLLAAEGLQRGANAMASIPGSVVARTFQCMIDRMLGTLLSRGLIKRANTRHDTVLSEMGTPLKVDGIQRKDFRIGQGIVIPFMDFDDDSCPSLASPYTGNDGLESDHTLSPTASHPSPSCIAPWELEIVQSWDSQSSEHKHGSASTRSIKSAVDV